MSRVSTFIGVIILIFTILCSNVFAGPTFVDEYDVTADETTPTGIIFNPEGTRMYVTGIDLIKDNGWSFKFNYERNQNETGYSDTLYIGATYIYANDSEYALALDGEKTFVNYTKNINGFDLKFDSNYSLFKEVPDYGANIQISRIF